MLRSSLPVLRALALVPPALVLAGCPSETTPIIHDTSSSGSAESTADTTIDPDSSSSDVDPTLTTTVDPDSSSGSEESSSSGSGLDGCGDGDIDPGELCDGDNLDGRDCESQDFVDGVLACNADCTLDTSGCTTVCGDGDVQGDEQCEGNDLGGADCVDAGFEGGDLGCNVDCTFDTSACENYECGDDVALGIEVCDGTDLDAEDCESLGFDGGTLACAADCNSFDLSGCFDCGDGVINGDEQCDGNQLGDETCVSLGTDGGVLGCNADCTFDLGECVGCGNGVQDPDEECDTGDFGGATCAGLGFDGGQLTCTAQCEIASESCFGLHTFCATPAAAIGPGAGVLTQSTIPVAGLAGGVLDVDVLVEASHTAVGDLDIDVRWVDGDLPVSLVDDQCAASDGIDATFDQDAAALPTCVGPVAISGVVLPLGNLDSYVGTVGSGNGTWELSIVDQIATNGGTLDQWCVAITTGSSCGTPFAQPSYDASVIFPEAAELIDTRMTIAFDGVNFWSSGGGSPEGNTLASHDADGGNVEYYAANLDLRSVFTMGDGVGPLFSRAYADPLIRVQDAPGVFVDEVSLVGGVLDEQSSVVWDEDRSEFVAHIGGNVSRWDPEGNFIGSIALDGYGELDGENDYPQNRGIVTQCGYYLTYFGGVLTAWDETGDRVAQTTLNGAGTSFDAYFSYSWAQGLFFVVDGAGQFWRGYDVF